MIIRISVQSDIYGPRRTVQADIGYQGDFRDWSGESVRSDLKMNDEEFYGSDLFREMIWQAVDNARILMLVDLKMERDSESQS